MKRVVLLLFILIYFNQINAQSINVGGVFPTIDHSGTISKKLDYSLYYFAAFPLVNFDKLDVSKDSYFHLFYAEQALRQQINCLSQEATFIEEQMLFMTIM